MFKNKHLLVAILIAPILCLIGYFAVNSFVGEKPKPARPGQSYLLVEKPNCRYSSGRCGLKNSEFELEFSFDRLAGERLLLKLKSEHPLDGVMLAKMVNVGDENQPEPMSAMNQNGLSWSMEIQNTDPENQRLHLVASSNGAYYIGDVSLKFTYNEPASN